MSQELSIGYTIKIILGILVIIAVVGGVYLIFKEKIMDFFGNLPGANITNTTKIFLGLLR
jgi:hypothetical protein